MHVFGLLAKRLDLVHELVPAAKTIAMLVAASATTPDYADEDVSDFKSAATALGIRALVLNIGYEDVQRDVVAAFATIADQDVGALLIGSLGVVLQTAHEQIISLATQHKIPTIFRDRASAAAGALSSYGPDWVDAWYQAGLYASRILKGERPTDLPVIRPTKFEFVINLKTARTIGFNVPPNMLAVADEVLE
jgi:putative ABC transport system substrate-binding protein